MALGAIIVLTSQIRALALSFYGVLEIKKIQSWFDLQWHHIHIKYYKNTFNVSRSSNISVCVLLLSVYALYDKAFSS
jgi:hypothetical protein